MAPEERGRAQQNRVDALSPDGGKCAAQRIGVVAPTGTSVGFNARAASVGPRKAGSVSQATREALGTASLSNWSRLSSISRPVETISPVTVPPGRARLAASPSRTSASALLLTITTGIVSLACLII